MACAIQIYNPKFSVLGDVDWNFPINQQDTISQIHPYPAKFIESLPRTIIQLLGCTENSYILDPFCGSGTTLLEAQRAGIPSVGIDINPIACLISRVKTQHLEHSFKEHCQQVILEARESFNNEIDIPKIPNLDHWFSYEVQKAVATLVLTINDTSDSIIKDALQYCLSSIIVRVSRQDSDTRYAAVDNNSTAQDVFLAFKNVCEKLWSAKQKTNFLVESKVITNDILKIPLEQIGKKVGLVITSPPYPNAYEYWLYHKYRMWWLGYDPISVRESEIGARPHYQKINGQNEDDFSAQMDKVFSLFDTTVIDGGFVCVIIGRSIIKGRYIDNAEIINKIASQRGYALLANIEREIKSNRKSFNLSYGKINTENILVFRKE